MLVLYLLASILCAAPSIFYACNNYNLNTYTPYEKIKELPEEIVSKYFLNSVDVTDIKLEQKDKDHVAHTAYYPRDPITCENPTFHDYLSRKKRNKHERDYSGLELSLLKFATQLLKHNIHVTYDGNPYVALCIYKQFHKNAWLFNTIATKILSDDPTTLQSIGSSLLKVLGNTIHKKMCHNRKICTQLVADFKTVLVQKTSYFVFPTIQIASADLATISPHKAQSDIKQLSHKRRFFRFNDQLMIRPLNKITDHVPTPTHKIYLCINKDIMGIYRAIDDTSCTFEGTPCLMTIYIDRINEKMVLQTLKGGDYNPLDIDFHADYAISTQRKNNTDDVINTLLRKSMKLTTQWYSSPLIKMLYKKAETDETKKFIAWAYQSVINPPISFEKITEWLSLTPSLYTRTAKTYHQLCNDALVTVSMKLPNNTVEAHSLFWEKHHQSKNEYSNYKHWIYVKNDMCIIKHLQ